MMKTFIFLAFLFFSSHSFSDIEVTCAPVQFMEKEIVCLKSGQGYITIDERVHLYERRIKKISNNPEMNPNDIVVTPDEDSFIISINDYQIMSLRYGDIDSQSFEHFEDDVEAIADNLREVLIEVRESSGVKAMVRGGVLTAIATNILIIIFFLYSKFFPRLYHFIEVKGRKIPSFKIQNWEVINSQRLITFILWLAHIWRTVLTLLALYIYVPLVLSFFPQTAPMAPTIFNFVAEPLKDMARTLVGYIPNIFIIIVIGVITAYALKLIRFFFDEIEKGNIEFEGFYADWATPSYMLVRTLVLAFATIVIFPYIPGSGSSAFKGVSVFFGILISLGSSSSIANIVAGTVITYMRPFRVGDMVKVNETLGVVTEKNLLVTRIKTDKNVDVTVPNSMILASHIVNYSNNVNRDGLVLPMRVDFGYEVPWQKVHEILIEAALRTPLVLEEPEPFVWHKKLLDNYVAYELNVYTKNAPLITQIESDLNQNIQDVCFEHGIELVSPIYTAIRDGEETTLPKKYRPENYVVKRFGRSDF